MYSNPCDSRNYADDPWVNGEGESLQELSSLQQNVGHASGIDSLMETTQFNLWQSQVLADMVRFHWRKYAAGEIRLRILNA